MTLQQAAEAALRLLESKEIKCSAPLTLAVVVQGLRDALMEQSNDNSGRTST